MDRAEAVAGAAQELYKTEQAVDAAIAQATTMIQTMMATRADLNLSAVTFTESQNKVFELLAALNAARTVAVEAHQTLAKDHRRMGWGVYAAGVGDKGDNTPIGTEPTGVLNHLRIAS